MCLNQQDHADILKHEEQSSNGQACVQDACVRGPGFGARAYDSNDTKLSGVSAPLLLSLHPERCMHEGQTD